MHNPSCDLTWRSVTFHSNSAEQEGGAVCIQDLTARRVRLEQCNFTSNVVRKIRHLLAASHCYVAISYEHEVDVQPYHASMRWSCGHVIRA